MSSDKKEFNLIKGILLHYI